MLRCFIYIFALLPCFAGDSLPELKLTSVHIREHNPLLPKLEPLLWQELVSAEKRIKASSDREKAHAQFLEIAAQLTKIHKLERKENEIKLGGITWNKKDNTISIPAKLKYPNPGMPLEVLLCQKKGRVHEALFLTQTRPLHLELLLHMAGFKVGSTFQLLVKSSDESRGVEDFITWKGKGANPLLWKFTGSEFAEQYIPDNAGEQIIIWSRNEAVLDVNNKDFSSLKVPLYTENIKSFPKDTQVNLVLVAKGNIKKK